jgi:hypothetical protein
MTWIIRNNNPKTEKMHRYKYLMNDERAVYLDQHLYCSLSFSLSLSLYVITYPPVIRRSWISSFLTRFSEDYLALQFSILFFRFVSLFPVGNLIFRISEIFVY